MTTRCKDCLEEGISTCRKTPYPGPRCNSHHRARRLTTRNMSWERRLLLIYGITADQYHAIYKYQGGKCFICQRATGARKRLSVDHCHKTGTVRGLLCQPCNKSVLGHLRDDTAAFERAIDYLDNPPAVEAGIRVITPDVALTLNGG